MIRTRNFETQNREILFPPLLGCLTVPGAGFLFDSGHASYDLQGPLLSLVGSETGETLVHREQDSPEALRLSGAVFVGRQQKIRRQVKGQNLPETC